MVQEWALDEMTLKRQRQETGVTMILVSLVFLLHEPVLLMNNRTDRQHFNGFA